MGDMDVERSVHPYELYLIARRRAADWQVEYPQEGEPLRMLERAITMVQRVDEYGDWEPYETPGLRLDGWIHMKNGYEFAFRMDKDIPYVVVFEENTPEADVWDWRIEHWEV